MFAILSISKFILHKEYRIWRKNSIGCIQKKVSAASKMFCYIQVWVYYYQVVSFQVVMLLICMKITIIHQFYLKLDGPTAVVKFALPL